MSEERFNSVRIVVEYVELIETNDNELDDESNHQESSLQLVVDYSDDFDANLIENQLDWINWSIFNRHDLFISIEDLQCVARCTQFAAINYSIIIRGFVGLIPLNNDLNRVTFYFRHLETIYTISMHRITLVVILKFIIARKFNINVSNIFLNVNGRSLIDSQTLMNSNINHNLIDWNLSHIN